MVAAFVVVGPRGRVRFTVGFGASVMVRLMAPHVIDTKATLSGYDAAIEVRVSVRVRAYLIMAQISRTRTA